MARQVRDLSGTASAAAPRRARGAAALFGPVGVGVVLFSLAVVGLQTPAQGQSLQELRERQREEAAGGRAATGAEEATLSDAEKLNQAFGNLSSDDEATWREAQRQVSKALARSGSASMDLLLKRGKDAIEREEWETALLHLTDLVNLAPNFAEGWNRRAQAHYQTQSLGVALADLGEAVAAEPRHYEAFTAMGVILEQINRLSDAAAAYRAALEIHPHFEAAKTGLERIGPNADGRPI